MTVVCKCGTGNGHQDGEFWKCGEKLADSNKCRKAIEFNIGEYAKVTQTDLVFKVCGFTAASGVCPEGWLIDEDGGFWNPKSCEPCIGDK